MKYAKMLAASSIALGAVECTVAGAPGRSRPLRLAALGTEKSAPAKSGGMGEMQRWHEEAASSRLTCTRHEGRQVQRLRGGSDMMMKSKPAFVTKFQNGLSSSRAVIMWVIKVLLAAFTGLLTTSAVMVAFEFTAHKVRPATDLSEMMPDYLAALVLVGAVVGSVLGSWVLTKLSPSHPTVLALGVSSLFTAAQYMNLQVVAHPQWYKFMGLASFIPPYLLTSILGSGGLSSTAPRATSKALRFESPQKITINKSSPAADPQPATPGKSSGSSSKTPSTPKTPKASEDRAPKTPKSSVKTSSKTPSKTPGKSAMKDRDPKTPKTKTPKAK